jgi:hypothetical protein
VRSAGPAVTYSPTASAAVPLARRVLTSEFGMGSGVYLVLWPPDLRIALCLPCAWQGSVGLSKLVHDVLILASLAAAGSDQADRAISIGQLSALLRVHSQPIDVVVYYGSHARPCFEGGFPLRCLQRLSCPFIATQHYPWQDNWSTSGTSTPVLSY